MRILKRVLEGVSVLLERAVTAALYPICRLRDALTGAVRVPILMYHQVGPPLEGVAACRDRVSPQRFEAQIRAVLDAGYRIAPLSELIRLLREGDLGALRRTAVLTFDDGYRGQFVFAYPVLRRKRLPATFFVTTGLVGKKAFLPHLEIDNAAPAGTRATPPLAWLPLSWDEVTEMSRNGVEIGSHAVTHRSLGRLDREEAEFEARLSKEILERRAGIRVDHFAYPFGSRACGDFHRGLQDALLRCAYRGACTRVIGRSGPGVDPLALPRIPMEERDGPFRVRCKLAGAYDWVGPIASVWQRLTAREARVDAALPAGMDHGLRFRR